MAPDIPYLLSILKTKKLSVLVENLDLIPLDLNLLLWDAETAGKIKIDVKKDSITPLVTPERTFNSDLASKLIRTCQYYWKQQLNPTRGIINNSIKDPASGNGYLYHEYICSLQYLIDSGQITEEIVEIPEVKDQRPYKKFVFLCNPENESENETWNREQKNKYIANFAKKKHN